MERNVGFFLSHEQFPIASLVEYGAAAETAGFDSVWTSDHFHPWQDNQGHAGHAWITLAAIGQRTSRIMLGSAVTCPIYRYHPAIVAQAFASLGALYPGRVFLGVGTGEAVNELPAGGGWGPYRERAARLREAVTLIRRLWTEEWVSHEGEAFPIANARIYERPAEPVPIFVAASGPTSAAIAGELGDGWITDTTTLLERPEVVQAYRRSATARGRDIERMPVLVEQYVFVGEEAQALEAARLWQFAPIADRVIAIDDPREIERMALATSSPASVLRTWLASRNPNAHIERIRDLFAAGATHVAIHSAQADQKRLIEFYGREVLPAIRQR